MNVALRPTMSVDQFLAWEDRQELRHEFNGVRTIAMTGGTAAHAGVQSNLIVALGVRLRGQRCRVYGSALKVAVGGSIRYPDAFVVCTPVQGRTKVVTDPVVVFEVLSESTADHDLVVKNAEYRATPSIRRYVILQQDQPGAMAFVRQGEDWVSELVTGEAGLLRLPEIGIEIPLAEVYAGLEPAER